MLLFMFAALIKCSPRGARGCTFAYCDESCPSVREYRIRWALLSASEGGGGGGGGGGRGAKPSEGQSLIANDRRCSHSSCNTTCILSLKKSMYSVVGYCRVTLHAGIYCFGVL